MARELVIAWAGRHQRSSWEEICASYRKRIERLTPVRDLAVKAKASPDDPQRRRLEGESLLAALPRPAFLVALDSRGELFDSGAWAARLEEIRTEWPHAVAFVLGSDLGLDAAVVKEARLVLSFGPFTLSHELARVVLYEQIFRALSMSAGMSYHREPL